MPRKGFTKAKLSEDELSMLYWDNNLSHSQIARKIGVSRSCVQRIAKKYGIQSRTIAESQTSLNITRTPVLNEQQKQLIYGSLLGDACLHRSTMRSNKTGKEMEIYKIFFYHTEKHLEYVEHKADILGTGVKTKQRCKLSTRISGHGSVMRGFAFSHTPTLKQISKDCLDIRYKKRITERWLDQLNWRGLSYWFMDDGCLMIDRRVPRASIVFHTQSFQIGEIGMLIRMLGRFGFRAIDGNDSTRKPIILINRQDEVFDFLRKTEQFIVPCMRYKNRILRGHWETIDEYNCVQQ